ncbi:pxmp2 4 family protein 4-like, partial [Nannochloropsis oceanica]
MLFKAVLPGTLAIACGDMLCQRLEGKIEICLERTTRMAITGALIVTPSAYYLGSKIERIVPKANTTFTTIAKAGLNATCSVFFIIGSFCGNNLLQGRGFEVLRAQLSERLLPTAASGVAYWTGANLLLFSGVVPQSVAATAAFSVLWNVRMSSALNMKTPASETALAKEERNRRVSAMRLAVGGLQKESGGGSGSSISSS